MAPLFQLYSSSFFGKIVVIHQSTKRMETLAEKLFTGKWRSYKTFRQLGGIHLSTDSTFQEFEFSHDRNLTIKNYEGPRARTMVETDQWAITFQKRKHFLNISRMPKMIFEVITVNHTVLVLLDTLSGEKTFFAKNHHWTEYIKSNKSIVI
jgi:hypothetical protein